MRPIALVALLLIAVLSGQMPLGAQAPSCKPNTVCQQGHQATSPSGSPSGSLRSENGAENKSLQRRSPGAFPVGRVVALDSGSAKLLKMCFPAMPFQPLIQSGSESFEEINQRALSMRDAGYLVYRSDQLSLNSRLFRDRLVAHGVHAVDLTRLAEQKTEQSRHEIASAKSLRHSPSRSFDMMLAFE